MGSRARKPAHDLGRARARATVGMLRRSWRHSSQTSRKGVHVVRHMLPYWSEGVAELETMIALWISAGPSLPFDSQKEES